MSLASIYSKGVLTRKCSLSINEIGKNIKEILESKLKRELEGKCCKDGYIKEDSLQIVTYSSGKIHDGSHIMFEVVIEVLIAFPVEGMLIEATADVITKAGIKASIPETDPLNDPFISVIGELVKPQTQQQKQPYVVLE
jgi:DNA-directed RNA polymerase subunit E'/Rpb7